MPRTHERRQLLDLDLDLRTAVVAGHTEDVNISGELFVGITLAVVVLHAFLVYGDGEIRELRAETGGVHEERDNVAPDVRKEARFGPREQRLDG